MAVLTGNTRLFGKGIQTRLGEFAVSIVTGEALRNGTDAHEAVNTLWAGTIGGSYGHTTLSYVREMNKTQYARFCRKVNQNIRRRKDQTKMITVFKEVGLI